MGTLLQETVPFASDLLFHSNTKRGTTDFVNREVVVGTNRVLWFLERVVQNWLAFKVPPLSRTVTLGKDPFTVLREPEHRVVGTAFVVFGHQAPLDLRFLHAGGYEAEPKTCGFMGTMLQKTRAGTSRRKSGPWARIG